MATPNSRPSFLPTRPSCPQSNSRVPPPLVCAGPGQASAAKASGRFHSLISQSALRHTAIRLPRFRSRSHAQPPRLPAAGLGPALGHSRSRPPPPSTNTQRRCCRWPNPHLSANCCWARAVHSLLPAPHSHQPPPPPRLTPPSPLLSSRPIPITTRRRSIVGCCWSKKLDSKGCT
jgi:hypothetical protein